jgi:hypothetical protein
MKLNFFWLSYYMTDGKPGQIDKVLFDDVVISTQYNGPLSNQKTLSPKINRVIPGTNNNTNLPNQVFYHQQFENIQHLESEFHDTGQISDSTMRITNSDFHSGENALQNTYLPKTSFPKGTDPGISGWIWRFFGDNKINSPIPIIDTLSQTKVFARWYHKFEEGFSSQSETGTLPPKMARMRCFNTPWNAIYSILFWIEGKKGHISIQQHTRAPGVEREWLPNYNTSFYLNTPENLGRWIHFEMGVTLGEGHHSDQIQAWADGKLICDLANQDLAGGYRKQTLNAMLWDGYWNNGAPREESRFFDDLVLSQEPIGPARTSTNPVLEIAQSPNIQYPIEYQIKVAQTIQQQMPINNPDRKQPIMQYLTVWSGSGFSNTIQLNSATGKFTGLLKGKNQLDFNTLYSVQIRQRKENGKWTAWSQWHATFATQWDSDTKPKDKTSPKGYLLRHKI